MAKLNKTWLRFLGEHLNAGSSGWLRRDLEDGFRPTRLPDRGSPTYDFVGRVRDAGLIEIVPTTYLTWPYGWKGTRLTEAGRQAVATLNSQVPHD